MIVAPAFASVVLDVDSTLTGIEGIDWLAARRDPSVAREIATLTDDAMRGTVALEQVYGARLAIVKPRREELDALAQAYLDAIAPGAEQAVHALIAAGVRVVIVSGGIRQAILLLADRLGVLRPDVYAVDVHFQATGEYAGFDHASPLATADGKRVLIEGLRLEGPVLAVGDGSTDLAARSVVDRFVGFTGFVRRDAVVRGADSLLDSFHELSSLVLP